MIFYIKLPKKNLRIDHVISFAHKLKNYQHLFFGECDEHRENRKHFVDVAHELSVIDTLFRNDFDIVIDNYALLLGIVDKNKLKLYRQKVLRAKELNHNFIPSVSNGLVAILQNLSTPSAQVFTSEAFELLKYDGYATPGLYEACCYITLQTESSLKRFGELFDKKSWS